MNQDYNAVTGGLRFSKSLTVLPGKISGLKHIVLAFIMLSSIAASAQVGSYTFAQSSGTYTALSGGTTWQSAAAVTTDGFSGQIPLGFTFRYNNKNYTSINISNNGYIVFGGVTPAVEIYTPISQTSASSTATNGYEGAVAGFAANLVASTGSAVISYGTSGSDFVIQFADMARTAQTADRINFQIRLTQGTNVIRLVYGSNTATTGTAPYPQVGLRGASFYDWRNLSGTTATTWSAPTSTVSVGTAPSTLTMRFTSTSPAAVPVSGLTYTFTPPTQLGAASYASLPATENFDSWVNGNATADLPNLANWRTWPSYGDRSWRRDNTTAATAGWNNVTGFYTVTTPASGGTARFHSYGATNGATGYMDYHLNFSAAGDKRLTFHYINTSGADDLKIYLSTDGGATFGSALATFTTASAFTLQTVNLGTSTSATAVVRFEATSDFGTTDIGIDNVNVIAMQDCTQPVAQATNLQFTAVTQTSFNASFTAASPATGGYLVVRSTNSTLSATPANGTLYTAGATLGGGTVVQTGTSTSFAQSGMTSNTQYYYFVYAYSTVCTGEPFYRTSDVLTASVQTLGCLTPGTYTINNSIAASATNFTTITSAVQALNAISLCGAISGNYTFNVSAGQTFNETVPAIIQTGTAAFAITFQKSGAGANPVVVPTPTSGTDDAAIIISGADYITFDGIDVNASGATGVEYGYLVRNASATNGAQYNTIRNAAITLHRGNTNNPIVAGGILQSSVPAYGGAVTATNTSGANSYNKYQNLTISSALNGIVLYSGANFLDLGNIIGTTTTTGRNTITDIGPTSGTAMASKGVHTFQQSGVKIFNTDITNVTSNQNTAYGIWIQLGTGNNEFYGNKITNVNVAGSTGTTSTAYGILASLSTSGTNNAKIYNNMISNLYTSYTGAATAARYAIGILVGTGSATSAQSYDVEHNSVNIAPSTSPTYSNTCFEIQNISAVYRLRNNIFSNKTPAQTGVAKHYTWVSTTTNIGASGSVSNYNDLYIASDVGTSGHVGRGGSNNYNTVANWTAGMTGVANTDANSVSVNPNFITDTNLYIAASSSSVNGLGTPIATVTTDIDGDARNATTPDLGADEYTPVAGVDVGATALASPALTGCYTAAETVRVTIQNYNSATHDFAANPVTVTVNVTGAATTTLSGTVNTGTLATNGTLNVEMSSTLNMVAEGTYTFNATTTMAGDVFAGNDAMAQAVRTVATTVTAPYSENFNASTATPANWVTTGWIINANHSQSGNGIYKNVYDNASSGTFIMPPKVKVPTGNYRLGFDYRLTDYAASTYPATIVALANTVSWGSLAVQVSTDCGVTYTTINTIDNTNHIESAAYAKHYVNLSAYSGQEIYVRVQANWNAVTGTSDWYVDIDNFSIEVTPAPVFTNFTSTVACGATTLLTINGTDLNNAAVTIGGTPITLATNTATQITANINTTLSGTIAVTTGGGTVQSATPFSFTNAPALTLSSTTATICAGSGSSAITVTAGQSDYTTYTWLPAAAVSGTAATGFTFSPSVSTSYTLTASNASGCSRTVTVNVTVNSLPSAVVVTPASAQLCSGQVQQLTATGGNTTKTVLREDFNTGATGWTVANNSIGGDVVASAWALYESAPGIFASNDESIFIMTDSDAQGSGSTTETYLTSPTFSLAGLTTASLQFYHYYEDNGTNTDNARVQISTNGGSNWSLLQTAYTTTQGTETAFVQATFNLNAYVGMANLKIRFRYVGAYDYYWAVDNVVITGNEPAAYKWTSSESNALFTNALGTIAYTGDARATVYAKPSVTSTVTATVTNAATCSNSTAVTITVNDKEWTGATSIDWNTATNWCGGQVPTITDNVVIPNVTNKPVISGSNAVAGTLKIATGAVVRVVSGNSLKVAGAINLEAASASALIIENNAILIQDADVANTGTGTATVHRNSSVLMRQDYTMWSSPVAGQKLFQFSPNTLANRFMTYNTLEDSYEIVPNLGAASTTTFDLGRGYLIRMPNSGLDANGVPTGTTASPGAYQANTETMVFNGKFTGLPNNGTVNYTTSQAGNGYNFIGNPYPSPISITAFFAGNLGATDGIAYIWRKRNGEDVQSAYCTVNSDGDFAGNFQPGADNPNGIIQTGQGFIVKALTPSLQFTNTMRSANTTNDGAFFRMQNEEVVNHRVWLNLYKGTKPLGQMLVAYKSNATMGVDTGIDAPFINDVATGLNSLVNGNAYAIQGRSLPFSSQDVVPLQFKALTGGSYSIAIDHFDGLFNGDQDIFLKDNLLGTVHNLKTAGAYVFATEAGVFNTRFEVVYTNGSLGIKDPVLNADSIVIYKEGSNLHINTGNAIMADIRLFDTRGRLVYEKKNINAATAVISELSVQQQVLIVQVTTTDNAKASKKVLY